MPAKKPAPQRKLVPRSGADSVLTLNVLTLNVHASSLKLATCHLLVPVNGELHVAYFTTKAEMLRFKRESRA